MVAIQVLCVLGCFCLCLCVFNSVAVCVCLRVILCLYVGEMVVCVEMSVAQTYCWIQYLELLCFTVLGQPIDIL